MNEITERIKSRIKECMRSGENAERDILRTVLGESQTKDLNYSDKEVVQVLKKSKQGCLDTLALVADGKVSMPEDIQNGIKREITLYDFYLPQTLSVEEISKELDGVVDAIRSAKSDGQATGVAMGHLKKNKLAVDGKDVAQVVKAIRENV